MKLYKKPMAVLLLISTIIAGTSCARLDGSDETEETEVVNNGMQVIYKPSNEIIENVSAQEIGYHVQNVKIYMPTVGDWNEVVDTATGQTYKELVVDEATNEIRIMVLLNRDARNHNFEDHGGAKRYADISMQNVNYQASSMNMTPDQLLASVYNEDMTAKLYRQYEERIALACEYENYLQQFEFTWSDDELADYDVNKQDTQLVVNYRTCTLYRTNNENDINDATALASEIANTVMTPYEFDIVVKQNSVFVDEITSGGYHKSTDRDFEDTDYRTVSDVDKAMAEWLWECDRKSGDMLVQVAEDNSVVRLVYFEESLPGWKQQVKDSKLKEFMDTRLQSIESDNFIVELNQEAIDKVISMNN